MFYIYNEILLFMSTFIMQLCTMCDFIKTNLRLEVCVSFMHWALRTNHQDNYSARFCSIQVASQPAGNLRQPVSYVISSIRFLIAVKMAKEAKKPTFHSIWCILLYWQSFHTCIGAYHTYKGCPKKKISPRFLVHYSLSALALSLFHFMLTEHVPHEPLEACGTSQLHNAGRPSSDFLNLAKNYSYFHL